MAKSNTDNEVMKDALSNIASNIDEALYSKLRDAMSIPSETYEEFETAELYFIELLLSDELRPWYAATCLRILGYTALADNFENFATNFNFPKEEPPQTKIDTNNPEIALLKLIKQLKSDLTKNELYGLRDTKSKTFEHIFSDFLIMDKLTPSLEMLRLKLQKRNREDLASLVSSHAEIMSEMSQVKFERTFRLCLDTLDVDIFSLLSGLRSSLHKEYAAFQSLSMVTKQFSMKTDFIPLTFTEEVDTRTLPLTEGSDSELQSLIENAKNQFEKKTRYIDAHTEIYSPSIQGELISLIGHPGTGKTFYCKKIINEFTNNINDAFRFVLLLSCRNSKWHTIEELYCKNPHQTQEMLHKLLLVAVPTFNNSQELVHVILNTEGSGLLLVIDSFDEYPSYQQFDSTLLYIILKRQVLTKATILITSRPGAWNKLLRGYEGHFVFQHSWQLIGFAPEQRDTFILRMLSLAKADTCHKFLANKPELNLLSLVPVNISLITGLVDSTDLLAQINTLTDVYTSLVLFKLDRQLKRLDEHSPAIYSISEMPADMLDEFNKLAELSYEGLVARQITFSSREIQSVTSGKYTIGLGLFHIIKVVTRNLTVVDYLSCPHLTFQEFLSAWHLSQKSLTEIVTFIQQIFTDNTWPAMKVCIRFLCGILTQSSSTIIPIIIDNLHKKSAPLLLAKYLNINYNYLHSHNTASHLSVLPYVLETQDSSIIASYHQLLCPDNTTIPHFYLPDTISPVDAYCISEFLSKLPQHSIVSVLSINISYLSTTILDTLHKSITSSISIDTLIVTFSYSDDNTLKENVKKHLPIHIADILYEVQQLHISNSQQLVEELQRISRYPSHISHIGGLQYIMSCIKLSINSFSIQTDIIQYQPLFHFMSSITNNASIHTPKHIHYKFTFLNLLDDIIINAFIDTLQSTATYVMFDRCYFTPQFMSRFVISQPKLAYLDINDGLLDFIRPLLSHPTIEESLFIHLKKLPIKGLYLSYVTLSNESILCDYLLSHTCLQELHLSHTTHSTPAVLSSIQHMSSLLYIHIDAKDKALSSHHSNTEESMRLYLSVLNRNLLALSYVAFSESYFLTACYDSIMYLLSQCHNLQCINISDCSLTSDHMHALATTINSLPALVYINICYNSDIRDTALIKLYETLTNNNTIRHINLAGCGLSSSSIPVIKSLIIKCASLQKIELHSNKFTSTDRVDIKQFAQQRNITVII